jgi:putative endonuclease
MEKEICCYILHSATLNKFYIGATQESVQSRLEKHLSGYYQGNKFTKKANDWTIFLKIEANDFSHALRIEKKIKNMKSSVYIKNLLIYTELIEKVKTETSTDS